MITPGDGFVNPCASAWVSFEKKRIVVVVVVVSHRFSPARQGGKAKREIFEIAIALSSVCTNSDTKTKCGKEEALPTSERETKK